MKTSTLSVRVDDDDAAFLAGLNLADARTPSEKLRALLRAERRRQENGGDLIDAAEMFADMLQQPRRRIWESEADNGPRSKFLIKLYDKLPRLMAAAYVGPKHGTKESVKSIAQFESEALRDVFVFIQEILELGLTSQSRCYDLDAFDEGLEPVVEIIDLINLSKERRRKGV